MQNPSNFTPRIFRDGARLPAGAAPRSGDLLSQHCGSCETVFLYEQGERPRCPKCNRLSPGIYGVGHEFFTAAADLAFAHNLPHVLLPAARFEQPDGEKIACAHHAILRDGAVVSLDMEGSNEVHDAPPAIDYGLPDVITQLPAREREKLNSQAGYWSLGNRVYFQGIVLLELKGSDYCLPIECWLETRPEIIEFLADKSSRGAEAAGPVGTLANEIEGFPGSLGTPATFQVNPLEDHLPPVFVLSGDSTLAVADQKGIDKAFGWNLALRHAARTSPTDALSSFSAMARAALCDELGQLAADAPVQEQDGFAVMRSAESDCAGILLVSRKRPYAAAFGVHGAANHDSNEGAVHAPTAEQALVLERAVQGIGAALAQGTPIAIQDLVPEGFELLSGPLADIWLENMSHALDGNTRLVKYATAECCDPAYPEDDPEGVYGWLAEMGDLALEAAEDEEVDAEDG